MDIERFVLLIAVLFILLAALPFVLLVAVLFILLAALLFVLITANTSVCDGSHDPQANEGGHAADDDCSIYQGRQQPQS